MAARLDAGVRPRLVRAAPTNETRTRWPASDRHCLRARRIRVVGRAAAQTTGLVRRLGRQACENRRQAAAGRAPRRAAGWAAYDRTRTPGQNPAEWSPDVGPGRRSPGVLGSTAGDVAVGLLDARGHHPSLEQLHALASRRPQ